MDSRNMTGSELVFNCILYYVRLHDDADWAVLPTVRDH